MRLLEDIIEKIGDEAAMAFERDGATLLDCRENRAKTATATSTVRVTRSVVRPYLHLWTISQWGRWLAIWDEARWHYRTRVDIEGYFDLIRAVGALR